MNTNKSVILKDPLFRSCPSCKALSTLRRSHSRNVKEKLVNHFTIYKTYRCKQCGWRGYLKTLTINSSSLKVFALYIVILVLSALITLQILKRIL